MKRRVQPLSRVSGRRAIPRLLRIAVRRWHTERGWRAVARLHLTGSHEVLGRATAMLDSASPRRRAVGLAIASQLMRRDGGQLVPFAETQTQQLLLRGLSDPHHDVVRSAVAGLGHRPHEASVAALLALSTHANDLMRWQVAVALGSYTEPEAVDGLIRLAADASDEVRDWATFGLGTLRSDDTPAIRAVLRRNLDDPDIDVRGEALVGLARRRDEGLVDLLLARLTPDCHVYELDAAEELADPRLAAPLQALADQTRDGDVDPYWAHRLGEALAACRPG